MGQISRTIFRGAEGLGEITLIVCLEWLTCLFLFIIVEFEKVLNNSTLFSCHESIPKGYNVQLSNCLTPTWDVTSRNSKRHASWLKCASTPSPPGKLAAQKIAFWRVLLHPNFLANKKGGSNLRAIIWENWESQDTHQKIEFC